INTQLESEHEVACRLKSRISPAQPRRDLAARRVLIVFASIFGISLYHDIALQRFQCGTEALLRT
ncbi:MAG: hypothetical protein WCL39_12380, partial [Armatimonadota bacterium]